MYVPNWIFIYCMLDVCVSYIFYQESSITYCRYMYVSNRMCIYCMFDISVLYTFYQDCSITYMLLIGSMDPMRSDVYILYVGHLCVVYI